MNNHIKISNNKVLKLTNALIREYNIKESKNFNIMVLQMENYIKTKGAVPVGPCIQKTIFNITKDGAVDVKINLIRQADRYISHIDEPYRMESIIRVPNCIYAHYNGPENKVKFAYDKINVFSFEEGIELLNESYIIFTNQQDEKIEADIFVEKKSNE